MTDRKKVIKGMEICYCPPSKCEDCPYNDIEENCNDALCSDTLTLLKEMEAVPVDTKMIGIPNGEDIEVYCCRDCRTVLDPAFHYCPNCGREVKWE